MYTHCMHASTHTCTHPRTHASTRAGTIPIVPQRTAQIDARGAASGRAGCGAARAGVGALPLALWPRRCARAVARGVGRRGRALLRLGARFGRAGLGERWLERAPLWGSAGGQLRREVRSWVRPDGKMRHHRDSVARVRHFGWAGRTGRKEMGRTAHNLICGVAHCTCRSEAGAGHVVGVRRRCQLVRIFNIPGLFGCDEIPTFQEGNQEHRGVKGATKGIVSWGRGCPGVHLRVSPRRAVPAGPISTRICARRLHLRKVLGLSVGISGFPQDEYWPRCSRTRPTTGACGANRCQMGSPCLDLGENWPCRHGAPRRTSMWHSCPLVDWSSARAREPTRPS